MGNVAWILGHVVFNRWGEVLKRQRRRRRCNGGGEGSRQRLRQLSSLLRNAKGERVRRREQQPQGASKSLREECEWWPLPSNFDGRLSWRLLVCIAPQPHQPRLGCRVTTGRRRLHSNEERTKDEKGTPSNFLLNWTAAFLFFTSARRRSWRPQNGGNEVLFLRRRRFGCF